MSEKKPQGVGTESHQESKPNQIFTLVFRGENPFLLRIADELTSAGHTVHIREVPVETRTAELGAAVNQMGVLEGKVISDWTMGEHVKKVVGDSVIDAYSLRSWDIESKDDVVNRVKPVIEEIRAAGLTPVVLHRWLGDHMSSDMSERHQSTNIHPAIKKEMESSETLKRLQAVPSVSREQPIIRDASDYYAAILSEGFDLPVITLKDFGTPKDDIKEALTKNGIDSESAVLLIDHHIYTMREEEVAATNFNSVKVVPICPCCIGTKATYSDKLSSLGLNVYPLAYRSEMENIVDNLLARNSG